MISADPAPAVTSRRDAWLAGRRGWKITYSFGCPGWWEATLDGVHMARYDDLGALMDRLESSYQLR